MLRITTEAMNIPEIHAQGVEITDATFMMDGKPLGKRLIDAYGDSEDIHLEWDGFAEDAHPMSDIPLWVSKKPQDIEYQYA